MQLSSLGTAQVVPGVVIGLVVALGSAYASHHFTRNRETERWEREDEVQRQRWEREDRLRLHQERVSLYQDFLSDVRFASEIRFYCATEDSIRGMLTEIRLLSSGDVSDAAEKLSLATKRWCETGAGFYRGGSEETEKRRVALDSAEDAFLKAARANLGIPEE